MSVSTLEKLHVGTSGWSYKDWLGPFYPEGTRQATMLERYCEVFSTVEVDSTYYRIPSRSMVEGWSRRTPDGFRFALKAPSTVTHGATHGSQGGRGERTNLEKVLDPESRELEIFLEALEPLGEKAAVVVLQFPYFRVKEMPRDVFVDRLAACLARVPASPRFAVEIRNKTWIDAEYVALLREHRIAAVLVDHNYMPPPRAQLELGLVTTDFVYARLLGDRYGIEKITKTWEKIVVEKQRRIRHWAEVLIEIIAQHGVGDGWVFVNNHFAGHGPATARELLAAAEAVATGAPARDASPSKASPSKASPSDDPDADDPDADDES